MFINEVTFLFYNKFQFMNKYFSEKNRKKLDKDLFQAKLSFTSETYIPLCFGFSLLISALSLISFLIIPAFSLTLFFLVFGISFYIFIRYPKIRKKKIAKEIEAELPFVLRSFGVELNINVPFETCLKKIAENNHALLSLEFKKILFDVETGANIPEALTAFSERIDSSFVKRAVSILIIAHQKGGKNGELLKKLADEQNAVMQSKLREYNGKLVMFSLVFIAFSAIIPAMFQVFIIVGSSFLNIVVSPDLAFWMPVAVFPLINIVLFLAIKSRSP